MQLRGFSSTSNRIFDFISLWILPVGYFLLLCALFFLPGRSLHHKLFYGLFSIPTLIALCLRPRELKEMLREPVLIAFCCSPAGHCSASAGARRTNRSVAVSSRHCTR